LRQTGNSLDLAIDGKGFFEVHDGENIYFSRQGNFTLDATGRLATAAGMAVAGLGGDIRLQSGQVRIDSLGRIYEKDQQVAQLKLIAFQDAAKLVPAGAGLYTAGKASLQVVDENINVRQGYTESSNVVAADEMVRLIEAMRRFEGGHKVIQWYDEMLEKALSRLGEF
jgi:flagellar basal-body rod protein FlgG